MVNFSRRKVIGMLAGGFVAFLTAPSRVVAAPTVRAGDICKKLGRRTTVGNKTFECVNSNGARVWKRVSDTAKPTTTTQPAAPSTSTAKPTTTTQPAAPSTSTAKPTTTTQPAAPSTSEVKVLDSSALAVGKSENVVVSSGGRNFAVVVTRTSAGVVAFNRACTHQGTLVTVNAANQLYCISHGSLFNLTTGAVIEGPASRALTQYTVTERSGAIYVTL